MKSWEVAAFDTQSRAYGPSVTVHHVILQTADEGWIGRADIVPAAGELDVGEQVRVEPSRQAVEFLRRRAADEGVPEAAGAVALGTACQTPSTPHGAPPRSDRRRSGAPGACAEAAGGPYGSRRGVAPGSPRFPCRSAPAGAGRAARAHLA